MRVFQFRHQLFVPLLIAWIIGAMVPLTETSLAQELDDALKDLVDAADGAVTPQDLARLDGLRQDPVDLNVASRAELEQLPWITPQQAEDVVQWRNRHGRYSRLNSLQDVPGFDQALVERLRPYVTVRASPPPIRGSWRMTGQQREQPSRRRSGWMGFRTEMAIGQHVVWGTRIERRMPDHAPTQGVTGYLDLHHLLVFDRVLIGQYDLEYGQGLVLGGRSRLQETGSWNIPFKWRSSGPMPARSSRQSGRFTGAVMVARLHALRLTVTAARARTVRRMAGVRASWTKHGTSIGMTIAGTTQGRAPPLPNASTLADEADAEGAPVKPGLVYGIDVDTMIGLTNLFGEVARSRGGGIGLAAGVLWELGRLDGGTVVRRSSRDFNSQFLTLSERENQDAYRVTADLRFRPDKQTVLTLSHDTRRHSGLPTAVRTTPTGAALSVKVMRRMARSVVMTAMWTGEHREEGTRAGRRDERINIRGQIDWHLTTRIRLRGRTEHRTLLSPASEARERERTVLADAQYRIAGRLTLSGRWVKSSGVTTTDPVLESEDEPDSTIGQSFTDRSARWSVFIRGPITSRAELSVRYTQAHLDQPWKSRLRKSDVVWTVQVDVVW